MKYDNKTESLSKSTTHCPTRIISLEITKDTLEIISNYSKKNNLTRSEVINMILETEVQNLK